MLLNNFKNVANAFISHAFQIRAGRRIDKIYYFYLASAFISHANTQSMHINSIVPNSVTMISLRTLYPAGFELGSSVPEAVAMSIALHLRQSVTCECPTCRMQ
jgi:hypothetical protein